MFIRAKGREAWIPFDLECIGDGEESHRSNEEKEERERNLHGLEREKEREEKRKKSEANLSHS